MKKQTHMLSAEHHEHLSKIGVPWLRPPYLHVEEVEYQEAIDLWRRTHPSASPEWLHMKALGHVAWAQHRKESQAATGSPVQHVDHRLPLWVIAGLLLALALAFFAPLAHCQFSKISTIQILNNGVPIDFHASPFNLNFTGCTVTASGITDTIACTTGSVTNNPAGSNFTLQTYSNGAFGFVPEVGLGKVLIDQGPGNAPAFGDPLVQGTQAAGSTTVPNPVVSGGSDYSGTPTVRTWKVDSNGFGYVVFGSTPTVNAAQSGSWNFTCTSGCFQTTQPISVASLPLPSGASTDATVANPQSTAGTTTAPTKIDIMGGKTTDVTPQYQPLPLTNSGAAVKTDGSATTQPVSAASLPLPTGAATSAKQPALGTAGTPSADVITVQGKSGMTPVVVDPSGVTSPVSIATGATNPLYTAIADGTNGPVAVKAASTQAAAADKSLVIQINPNQPNLSTALNVAIPANSSVNVAQVGGSSTSTAATGVQKVGIVGNAGVAIDAATGAAPPANAILHAGLGSGATGGFLVGVPVADTYKAINISTATTTLLITGVSGRQVRISALHLIAAGADNVALIEGTGATCGTGSLGMAGGTTAASGYNLAANGGLAFGSGFGTILQTVTTGDSVCAVTSAAVQLSGGIEYTIY